MKTCSHDPTNSSVVQMMLWQTIRRIIKRFGSSVATMVMTEAEGERTGEEQLKGGLVRDCRVMNQGSTVGLKMHSKMKSFG